MCRSAVIALHGRTPRQGTAGHVATRRGLDRTMRPGRPPRGPLGGSRAAGRWPGAGAGLDRGEMRRGGGLGRTPLPCREQSRQPLKARGAETRLAAAAGHGTPLPPLRTPARRASRASRSQTASPQDPGRDGGLPIRTQLPHARPALRGAAGHCCAPTAGRGNPLRTLGARRCASPLFTSRTRRNRPSTGWSGSLQSAPRGQSEPAGPNITCWVAARQPWF